MNPLPRETCGADQTPPSVLQVGTSANGPLGREFALSPSKNDSHLDFHNWRFNESSAENGCHDFRHDA